MKSERVKQSDTIAIRAWYYHVAHKTSDINEHLPMLSFLAAQCDHVTEFGVRTGDSTLAFMHGLRGKHDARLRSYDINDDYNVKKSFSSLTKTDWVFVLASTLTIPKIEPTDLLFIDTLHSYTQVSQELALHGDQAKRWIAFHDTETFGTVGDDRGEGIGKAIQEFIDARPEWRIVYHAHRNNGLTVIEREVA
jgi:translation elongation factor P/translation initiation factor 5A